MSLDLKLTWLVYRCWCGINGVYSILRFWLLKHHERNSVHKITSKQNDQTRRRERWSRRKSIQFFKTKLFKPKKRSDDAESRRTTIDSSPMKEECFISFRTRSRNHCFEHRWRSEVLILSNRLRQKQRCWTCCIHGTYQL